MTKTQLQALLDTTQGRFFAIEFIKTNGKRRKVNGHISRKGDAAPRSLKHTDYCVMYARTQDKFVSVHPERVLNFQCGGVTWTRDRMKKAQKQG